MTCDRQFIPGLEIIIHRGTRQIGGSCVEVRGGRSRVILDAGLPLPPLDAVRRIRVMDVPRSVRGLFESDGPPVDALLVSHAHGDHAGLVSQVRREVPVYVTKATSQMLLAGSCFAASGMKLPREQQRTLHPPRSVRIGDLRVSPFEVDHSIPGACAFLIEHQGARLLYSGDLRMHGPQCGSMSAWLDNPTILEPDVLVMEGTLLGQPERSGVTEEDVGVELRKALSDTRGLALLMFSPQNLARLHTIMAATRASGRCLVIDLYTLFVLHLLKTSHGSPNPFDPSLNLRVCYSDDDLRRRSGPMKNLRRALPGLRITLDEVLAKPPHHALVFRSWMLERHPEILGAASLGIYSYWRGYVQTSNVSALKNQFEAANVRWLPLHASGHIHHEHLLDFVRRIRPRELVPIHTERGDEFANYFPDIRVMRLEDGEPWFVNPSATPSSPH